MKGKPNILSVLNVAFENLHYGKQIYNSVDLCCKGRAKEGVCLREASPENISNVFY